MTILYLILLLVLGLYSYSQIDLNLTLLQTPWFLGFQNTMIQLGYYQRPLSAAIFIILTILLFLVKPKNIFWAIGGVVVLGLFSYPAFSHDIFNYIFDARIAIWHHANPYTSTALMFPDDTWTRFMHWTHRTYPYGPLFLIISFVPYILGLSKFILTLFWFKVLMIGAYLGSCYVILKLTDKKGLAYFALNPLIIYEVIIAGHLDVIMLFFALGAIYKKSNILWLLSAGIKYVTILLFPRFSINWLIALAYGGAVAQIFSRELLPHYFIVPLGFTALAYKNRFWFWMGIIISFILLLMRYFPFILTGNWL